MNPFSSISGVWMSRQVMRAANQDQWRRARESKKPEDFEAAKRGADTMNVVDVLMGLLRLGRG